MVTMDDLTTSNSITTDAVLVESQHSLVLDGLISDKVAATIRLVVDVYLNNTLSYIGLIGNVLQIIVFCKLGFRDTFNISLTFLAAWDLFRCICNAADRLSPIIELFSPAVAISYRSHLVVLTLNSGIAGYVSSVLASYIAIERCLCVTFPLTIRYLLTPKVVLTTNTIISVTVYASLVPSYLICELYKVFYPPFNATVYLWRFNSLWTEDVDTYLVTMYMLLVLLSMVAIGVSTAIISYQLKKMSKFRDRVSASARDNIHAQKPSRDRQVIKMLLVIIAVYIVNSLPRMLFFAARKLVPGFDHQRRYHNALWVSVNVMNVFDFVNAAINPFILYSMSSQFKAMFWKTFLCHKV